MKNKITFFAILLIAVTTFNSLFSQTQLGEDIDGETADDHSGWFVSLSSDGSWVAIGAPENDGNGENAGHVRVYEWNGGSWLQVGEDIDGETAGDRSGGSVSLSSDGSRVAIGAPSNNGINGNGSNSGHVRVYEWNGSSWFQVGEDINGETAGDYSGSSVSLSSDGSRVAIGAPNNHGNGDDNAGHVRVYEWNGSSWFQVGEDIDGEAAFNSSGWSVSLSSDGSWIAIGATGDDGNGDNAGHVRIYEWNGSSWSQVGEDIDGEAAENGSGFSVSLSSDGSRVAIGAPGIIGNGDNTGHVRVYEMDGVSWIQVGEDIDGEAQGDFFGWSVSLSSDGSRLAIGAFLNDGNGAAAGHARVYEWNGSSSWLQVGTDIDGEAAENGSGGSVSLSADGNRVAIGAIGNNGNGSEAGHVRVYEFAPVSTMTLEEKAIIDIFPNPTPGKIELLGVEYATVKIIDNFGRVIWKAEQSGTEIDVAGLVPGIYFIQISSENQWITKRIIKM